MPSAPKTLFLTVLLLSPLAGCSDSARKEQVKLGEQFKTAVAAFDQSQSGYVPHNKKAPADLEAANLENYQSTQLGVAGDQLQPLIDKGTQRQRAAARRLLADVELSNAGRAADSATVAWAATTRDSSGLLGLMIAVDAATSRAKQAEASAGDATAALEKANQDLAEARTHVSEAEKNVADLQPKIDQLDASIAKLKQQRDTALAENRGLVDKAFVSKGDEQLSLYRQADAAMRNADTADADARRQEVSRDLAQHEMTILAKQLDLARDAAKAIETQAHAEEESLTQAKSNQEAALDRKQKAAEQLDQRFAAVAKTYADSVEAPFAAAEQKANHAVEVLSQGVAHAPAEDQRVLQMDLLGARLAQAYILTQHVTAAGSHQKLLSLLADHAQQSLPGKTAFAEAAKHTEDGLNKAFAQGKKVTEDGLSLATELAQSGGSDPDFMATVGARREILTKYNATLSGVQTGGAPTE